MYSKYLLITFSFFVLLTTIVPAKSEVVKPDAIKALVEKVKTVAPSERRVLMNELKIKLRSMHQETRKQVMLELRTSFNKQQIISGHTGIESNAHHQSTMSMTESKNMQEHMKRDSESMKSPPGKRPPTNLPPGHTPMRGM